MANVTLADDGQYSELEQNDAPSNGEKKLGKNAPVAMAASNTEAVHSNAYTLIYLTYFNPVYCL